MDSRKEANFWQFSDDLLLQCKTFKKTSRNSSIQMTKYTSKRPKWPAEHRRNVDFRSVGDSAPSGNPVQKKNFGSGFGSKGESSEGTYYSPPVSTDHNSNSKGKGFRTNFVVNGTVTKGYRIGRQNRWNIREDNKDCNYETMNIGVDNMFKNEMKVVGGYIFACNNDTVAENVMRQIFRSGNCGHRSNREQEICFDVDLENGANTYQTASDQATFDTGFQNLRNSCRTLSTFRSTARTNNTAGGFSFREANEQKYSGRKPSYGGFVEYMIPSLLTLITLKYQSKTVSLFVENPVQAWCFLITACIYWLIEGVTKQMQPLDDEYFMIFDRAALVSAALSAISLVSILFPRRVSLVLFLMGTCLAVVLPVVYHAYGRLKMGTGIVFHGIWTRMLRAMGNNLNEESSLPV